MPGDAAMAENPSSKPLWDSRRHLHGPTGVIWFTPAKQGSNRAANAGW
jgi:hypothetical protein